MKNKLVSLLVSFLIAFGLWTYVITEVSPNSETTIDDIPLIAQGEALLNERGLMITGWSSTTVDLTLSGNRSDLNELNRSNITLKVDLTGISDPGVHKIDYNISFPGNVAANAFTREKQYPESVSITVEKRATKSVVVNPVYEGVLPEGYVARRGNIELDNPKITVTGPESVVSQIEQAQIAINLTDQTESISQSYRYTLCDKDGNPVDSELITVNVEEVHVDLTIHRIKRVQLDVVIVDGGGATAKDVTYEIDPAIILISGSDAALEQVGDVLILGEIDLAEYEKNARITFEIPVFEGVTNESGKAEAVVDLKFEGLTTREITIEKFVALNVPEGLEAEFITERLTIVVRGPSELIRKLTINDFVVEVDFSGMGEGVSTYQVTIRFSDDFKAVGVLGKPSVTAGLAFPDEEE